MRKVLELLACGYSDMEIASEISVSHATVARRHRGIRAMARRIGG